VGSGEGDKIVFVFGTPSRFDKYFIIKNTSKLDYVFLCLSLPQKEQAIACEDERQETLVPQERGRNKKMISATESLRYRLVFKSSRFFFSIISAIQFASTFKI